MNSKVDRANGRLAHSFSDADADRVASEMLHLRFMKTIKEMMGAQKNKELAEALGTSKAYVSKLFYGDKLVNMKLLSQLERLFDGRFVLTFKRNASVRSLRPTEDGTRFLGKLAPNAAQPTGTEPYEIAA